MPAAKESGSWPRARVLGGAAAMAISTAMFLLDGFHLTDGLRVPATLFLVLAGFGLFGMTIPDILRALAVITGGISAAALKAAESEREGGRDADA